MTKAIAMRWLNVTRPPCALQCAYCGTSREFRHARSYEHDNETLSLYECPTCQSLVYDLKTVEAPIVSQSDAIDPEAWRSARYVIEAGFSSYHVAMCALSALPGTSTQGLREHVFVDVGAGLGMASLFVKTLYGMPTVTIEPSYTGKISQEMLKMEVHRAYFEQLPESLLAELTQKPCCLHLNMVVEHLVDPYSVLRDMVGRVKVEVLAVIVPDAAAIDLEGPFLNALPFLAPRDHRHLPSKRGMEMLMKRLGFAHVHVDQSAGVLTGVGARSPTAFPNDRTVKLAEHLFLENLMRHPEPLVADGAAARLLPIAILNANAPLTAALRERFGFEGAAGAIMDKIRDRAWDELPSHVGPSCYWLGFDAFSAGRLSGALSLLDVTIAFADLVVADYPHQAMTPLEFKWAALMLQAKIYGWENRFADAERCLRTILDSRSEPRTGARLGHLREAEVELAELAKKTASQEREAPAAVIEARRSEPEIEAGRCEADRGRTAGSSLATLASESMAAKAGEQSRRVRAGR